MSIFSIGKKDLPNIESRDIYNTVRLNLFIVTKEVGFEIGIYCCKKKLDFASGIYLVNVPNIISTIVYYTYILIKSFMFCINMHAKVLKLLNQLQNLLHANKAISSRSNVR